jgi:hypothetical protein
MENMLKRWTDKRNAALSFAQNRSCAKNPMVVFLFPGGDGSDEQQAEGAKSPADAFRTTLQKLFARHWINGDKVPLSNDLQSLCTVAQSLISDAAAFSGKQRLLISVVLAATTEHHKEDFCQLQEQLKNLKKLNIISETGVRIRFFSILNYGFNAKAPAQIKMYFDSLENFMVQHPSAESYVVSNYNLNSSSVSMKDMANAVAYTILAEDTDQNPLPACQSFHNRTNPMMRHTVLGFNRIGARDEEIAKAGFWQFLEAITKTLLLTSTTESAPIDWQINIKEAYKTYGESLKRAAQKLARQAQYLLFDAEFAAQRGKTLSASELTQCFYNSVGALSELRLPNPSKNLTFPSAIKLIEDYGVQGAIKQAEAAVQQINAAIHAAKSPAEISTSGQLALANPLKTKDMIAAKKDALNALLVPYIKARESEGYGQLLRQAKGILEELLKELKTACATIMQLNNLKIKLQEELHGSQFARQIKERSAELKLVLPKTSLADAAATLAALWEQYESGFLKDLLDFKEYNNFFKLFSQEPSTKQETMATEQKNAAVPLLLVSESKKSDCGLANRRHCVLLHSFDSSVYGNFLTLLAPDWLGELGGKPVFAIISFLENISAADFFVIGGNKT